MLLTSYCLQLAHYLKVVLTKDLENGDLDIITMVICLLRFGKAREANLNYDQICRPIAK